MVYWLMLISSASPVVVLTADALCYGRLCGNVELVTGCGGFPHILSPARFAVALVRPRCIVFVNCGPQEELYFRISLL